MPLRVVTVTVAQGEPRRTDRGRSQECGRGSFEKLGDGPRSAPGRAMPNPNEFESGRDLCDQNSSSSLGFGGRMHSLSNGIRF